MRSAINTLLHCIIRSCCTNVLSHQWPVVPPTVECVPQEWQVQQTPGENTIYCVNISGHRHIGRVCKIFSVASQRSRMLPNVVRDVVCTTQRVQASLVIARLWSHTSERIPADNVNQYLGWTVAQLSRNVCSSPEHTVPTCVCIVSCTIVLGA